MKSKLKMKAIIAFLIIVISILHYYGGTADSPIHNFYRLLFYIPIILAAFHFAFKGGVLASIIVSLIYSPFLLLSVNAIGWKAVNELLDVFLYFVVGIITGILVEKKNLSMSKLDSELKRYVLLENYTKGIIESIKSGVVAVNNDMLITMINQGAKKILNISGNSMGQNFSEVFSCCDEVKGKVLQSIKDNLNNENIKIRLLNGDKLNIISLNIYPLTLEGTQRGIVIILEDITEKEKLQQQLQRSEKLAALGELSTGIAHEIRNPLGIIKAVEQTMKNELKNNYEAVKELEIIDEEIERANRVVKALMDFGKPSKDIKTQCSVIGVLQEILTITNRYFLQHGVSCVLEENEVSQIYGDKEQIKQAFINIIFNAVQAMPEGGKLNIKVSQEDGWNIRIAFKDNGIGIPEENLEKIFNPFYTTKDDGTGLGLPIVNRVIDDHNGRINVSSTPGEGTLFEVILPAAKEV